MADATVLRLDEMESVYGGVMVRARASLGVRSFGMQVMNLPPDFADYPLHDESGSGQEEVYVVLAGSGALQVGDEEHALAPGVFARVAPAEKRKIVPGAEGLRLLALGGVRGKAYEPGTWTELGAPLPTPTEA